MATLYVRSTDGSDADNGTTWALAKASLAGAAAIDAAGDTIYVSQSHAESNAAAQSIALAGTIASPVKVICGNDAAEPPTAVATSATVTTTGANAITISGNAYFYGITFINASGAGTAAMSVGQSSGQTQRYENCSLQVGSTDSISFINIGQSGAGSATKNDFRNCTFKFGHANQRLVCGGEVRINGGALVSGSSAIVNFCDGFSNRPMKLHVENFDVSLAATNLNLVSTASVNGAIRAVFRNCKLPSGWNGLLTGASFTVPGCRAEMYNCAAGDTNYALWIEDFAGSVRHETTIVRNGGASDGTTNLSWKMVTTADAEYPLVRLETPEFGVRISTVGASKTITIEIIHDSTTALTDAEVWLEVEYLGTSGVPLGVHVNDAKADVLATAANQTSSSETWTTTGMTNPNKQKLAVSFTPMEVGMAICKVVVAKPSYTVYVDPKPTVS